MRELVVAIALVVCFTGSSFAQSAPAQSAPAQPAPAQPAPAQPTFGPPSEAEPVPVANHERHRDPTTALTLSVGGTFASLGLLALTAKVDREWALWPGVAGLIVGPTLGHWYGGAIVTRGTGLRLAGMLAAAYGLLQSLNCEGDCRTRDEVYFYGGVLLFIGGTIDDIATARGRVRARNQRLESFSIAPMTTSRGGGLALGGRF